MPELPEVENLRQGLEKYILGQKILSIKVSKPKLVSGKGTLRSPSKKKVSEFINELTKENFVGVDRRAKNLIFRLTNNKIILAHLKMTGQFIYLPAPGLRRQEAGKSQEKVVGGHPIELSENKLPNKHSHIIFELENGTLYYNDTRMFGYVVYYPHISNLEEGGHFKNLGLEPVSKSFTLKYFLECLKDRKSRIKTVLMNQEIVTGIGNIYADESLFEAGINPVRPANTLTKTEIERLYNAIKRIINKAIKVGGSSVATYRLIDESRGNYAREHKVYGKHGKKCTKCNSTLKKILINTRTTVFCPNCQV